MPIVSKDLERLFTDIQLYSIENGLLHVAEIKAVNDIFNLQLERLSTRSNLPFSKFANPKEAENFLDLISEAHS